MLWTSGPVSWCVPACRLVPCRILTDSLLMDCWPVACACQRTTVWLLLQNEQPFRRALVVMACIPGSLPAAVTSIASTSPAATAIPRGSGIQHRVEHSSGPDSSAPGGTAPLQRLAGPAARAPRTASAHRPRRRRALPVPTPRWRHRAPGQAPRHASAQPPAGHRCRAAPAPPLRGRTSVVRARAQATPRPWQGSFGATLQTSTQARAIASSSFVGMTSTHR